MRPMADKDVEGVLSELEPICEAVVCVPMDSPRAMELDDLVEIADDVFGSDRVHSATNLVDAVDLAAQLAESSDDPLPSSGVLIVGFSGFGGPGARAIWSQEINKDRESSPKKIATSTA